MLEETNDVRKKERNNREKCQGEKEDDARVIGEMKDKIEKEEKVVDLVQGRIIKEEER